MKKLRPARCWAAPGAGALPVFGWGGAQKRRQRGAGGRYVIRMGSGATTAADEPLVLARELYKSFDSYPVLRGLNCSVRAGEFVAVTGESGSGKSTFLSLLAGLDRADAGVLRVAGEEPAALPAARLVEYRRRNVALIFQDFNLIPTLSVLENITLPLLLRGEPERVDVLEQRAASWLDRVGLRERATRLPQTLSGGEMQRVAIARALALRPRVLLADEPTGSLDSRNGAAVLELLGELHRENGLTILMVTHSARAAACAGRELHIRDGVAVQ